MSAGAGLGLVWVCVCPCVCADLLQVCLSVCPQGSGVQALCAHRRVYKGSVCTQMCVRLPMLVCTCVCVGMHEQGLCVCNQDKQS